MSDKKGRQKETIKKVLSYLKHYRIFLIFSLILAAASVALQLYIPILTGNAIDLIVTKGQVDFAGLFVILKRMIVVIGITAVCQWLMNVCNNKITYNTIRDVRRQAFDKLEILPLKYIDGRSQGEIVSRIIADVDQFADGLLMGFTQFFTGVITIVGTLLFMLSVNVTITIVVVIVTPLSLVVASFIAKRTYSMFQAQSEARGEQTAFIDDFSFSPGRPTARFT